MTKKPILIVEAETETKEVLCSALSQNGYLLYLVESGERALRLLEERAFDLVIAAVQLSDGSGFDVLDRVKSRTPGIPVILMDRFGTVDNAVSAMKKGASEYVLKPLSPELVKDRVDTLLERDVDRREIRPGPAALPPVHSIITADRKMKDLLTLCERVASSRAPVLIRGESGTGKELFARHLHSHGPRCRGPFVAVNCASLPESLLESELFGHERGAFTGAFARKIGKFELADRGTILLDEITEMNPYLQAKILRVLQENEVDRVGGQQPVPVDVRVIATTNREVEESIEKGDFREDLYYRLNVITIKVPPLRERVEDIEVLARAFLKSFSENYGKPMDGISEEAMAWLRIQEWRGNVRELKNTIERGVLMAFQRVLSLSDLAPCDLPEPLPGAPVAGSSSFCLREAEKGLIFKALEKTEGNRTQAARILGISIRTLRNKLNEYKQGVAA
jgi:DNA-binding NtrC family response regulator